MRYAIAPAGSQPPERLSPALVADLAASFQEAVVDVLVAKCRHALEATDLATLAIGGGVAANCAVREPTCGRPPRSMQFRLCIAPLQLCTDDNAVMGAIRRDRTLASRPDRRSGSDLERILPGLVR